MQCCKRYKYWRRRRAGLSDPPSSGGSTGCALLGVLIVAYGAVSVSAQSAEHFALDTVLSIDKFAGENVSNHPQIIIDISGGVRISDHVQAYIRPWFRLPRPNTPT